MLRNVLDFSHRRTRLAEVGAITILPPQFYDLNLTLAFQHVPIWAEAHMRRSRQAAVELNRFRGK